MSLCYILKVQKNEAVELESGVLREGAEHLHLPSILKEDRNSSKSSSGRIIIVLKFSPDD